MESLFDDDDDHDVKQKGDDFVEGGMGNLQPVDRSISRKLSGEELKSGVNKEKSNVRII